MRECCTYGSARGVPGDRHSDRDSQYGALYPAAGVKARPSPCCADTVLRLNLDRLHHAQIFVVEEMAVQDKLPPDRVFVTFDPFNTSTEGDAARDRLTIVID